MRFRLRMIETVVRVLPRRFLFRTQNSKFVDSLTSPRLEQFRIDPSNGKRRVHEIGIGMALGAQRGDVLRMVIKQGLILTVIGLAIGLAGAFALTRYLSSLLYEVSPTDPITLIGVVLLLGAVAMIACYIPARRASRIDPMKAVRYE